MADDLKPDSGKRKSDGAQNGGGNGANEEGQELDHHLANSRLFWIIMLVMLAPSAYFIVGSFIELDEILATINNQPTTHTLSQVIEGSANLDDAEMLEVRGKLALELDTILHRHQRSQAQLASRTWLRFMSLTFGAILIVIGGAFVLGRISSPRTKMDVATGNMRVVLASSSPGLFMVLFGCGLVIAPIATKQVIWTHEGSSYLGAQNTTIGGRPFDSPVVQQLREEYLRNLQSENPSAEEGG